MLEQLADGDVPPVEAVAAQQAGQIGVDGGVEADLALGDQLQDDDGDEGLGVAAGPDLPVDRDPGPGGQVADPGGVGAVAAVAALDGGEGGGHPVLLHQRVEALLNGVRARCGGGRGRGEGGQGEPGGGRGRHGVPHEADALRPALRGVFVHRDSTVGSEGGEGVREVPGGQRQSASSTACSTCFAVSPSGMVVTVKFTARPSSVVPPAVSKPGIVPPCPQETPPQESGRLTRPSP